MPWPGRAKGSARRTNGRGPQRAATHLFHGVAIEPGEDCECEAVLKINGKRFLSDDAPRLPLDRCTEPRNCRCYYKHFDDRRTDFRRESDEGLPVKLHPNESREGPGRRITDG